jgi:hypothetical protein
MKLYITLTLVTLFALFLAACGGAAPAAPAGVAPEAGAASQSTPAQAGATPGAAVAAPAAASRLDLTYENALPQRNQLLLGIVRLADGSAPITAEQARKLLPLWQGIRATLNSGAASEVETNALLAQIEAVLTDPQIAAIREMKLTQTQLQEWAKGQGLTVGTGEGTSQGQGKSLSAEARATRQAERAAAGGNSLSQALLDAVIKLMEAQN